MSDRVPATAGKTGREPHDGGLYEPGAYRVKSDVPRCRGEGARRPSLWTKPSVPALIAGRRGLNSLEELGAKRAGPRRARPLRSIHSAWVSRSRVDTSLLHQGERISRSGASGSSFRSLRQSANKLRDIDRVVELLVLDLIDRDLPVDTLGVAVWHQSRELDGAEKSMLREDHVGCSKLKRERLRTIELCDVGDRRQVAPKDTQDVEPRSMDRELRSFVIALRRDDLRTTDI